MTIETNLASRQATREATARQCETDAQDALERFLRQHIPAATGAPVEQGNAVAGLGTARLARRASTRRLSCG
jgi:hypothetical protein